MDNTREIAGLRFQGFTSQYEDTTSGDDRYHEPALQTVSCSRVSATLNSSCKIRRELEKSIPYRLRCRAGLLALASHYTDPTAAISDSPEPARNEIALTFQVSRYRRRVY